MKFFGGLLFIFVSTVGFSEDNLAENTDYRVRNDHSGKCLTLAHASSDRGIVLEQQTCSDSPLQVFQFQKTQSPLLQIKIAFSNYCADVAHASEARGVRVHQWNCHGGASQLWNLVSSSPNTYKIISEKSKKCLSVMRNFIQDWIPVGQFRCGEYQASEGWEVEAI